MVMSRKETDKANKEWWLGVGFVAFGVLGTTLMSISVWYSYGMQGALAVWGGTFTVLSILFGVALGRDG